MRSLFDFVPPELLVESSKSTRAAERTLGLISGEQVPIEAVEAKWCTLYHPTRLARVFKFKSTEMQIEFVSQLLEYQEKTGHHAKIIIDSNSIIIETYTHDVNDVTELDQELAQFADELYNDVQYYFITREQENE